MEFSLRVLLGTATEGDEASDAMKKFVGEKVINRAVNEFSSGKYKEIRKRITELIEKEGYDGAYDRVTGMKFVQKKEISDLLGVADGRGISIEAGTITSAVSNNPLDFDSRALTACIFLPMGMAKMSVLEYCGHPRARLVKYEQNGETVGAVVSLLDNGILFVNSVEGTPAFRSDVIFDIVLEDMKKRAEAEGARHLIFYSNPVNRTPKKFVEYINKKGIREVSIPSPVGDFNGATDIPPGTDTVSGYAFRISSSADEIAQISSLIRS
jgi:hypothetical protein